MFASGIVVFLLGRYNFSAPAFVMAFILGQLAEMAFGRSLLMLDGDMNELFARPVFGDISSGQPSRACLDFCGSNLANEKLNKPGGKPKRCTRLGCSVV